MTQFDKLINYTNKRLATAGFELTEFAKAEMLKRFNKPEDQGGYSSYWLTQNDHTGV